MEYRVIRANDYLAHYGIKGMKWRIRQSYDRSGPGYDPGTGVHTVGKKITTGLGTAKVTKKVKTTKTKTKTKPAKTKKETKKTSDTGKKAVESIINKTPKKAKTEAEPAKKTVKPRQVTPFMRNYQKKKQEEKKRAALKTAKKTGKGRYVV